MLLLHCAAILLLYYYVLHNVDMLHANKSRGADLDSPESQIAPYEDLNTKQSRITGEKFPTLALVVCDNCHWCYTLINEKGTVKVCPRCEGKLSKVPMNLDEVCVIEEDEKRGFTITFDRRLPLR
jgi:hypothetical protein